MQMDKLLEPCRYIFLEFFSNQPPIEFMSYYKNDLSWNFSVVQVFMPNQGEKPRRPRQPREALKDVAENPNFSKTH